MSRHPSANQFQNWDSFYPTKTSAYQVGKEDREHRDNQQPPRQTTNSHHTKTKKHRCQARCGSMDATPGVCWGCKRQGVQVVPCPNCPRKMKIAIKYNYCLECEKQRRSAAIEPSQQMASYIAPTQPQLAYQTPSNQTYNQQTSGSIHNSTAAGYRWIPHTSNQNMSTAPVASTGSQYNHSQPIGSGHGSSSVAYPPSSSVAYPSSSSQRNDDTENDDTSDCGFFDDSDFQYDPYAGYFLQHGQLHEGECDDDGDVLRRYAATDDDEYFLQHGQLHKNKRRRKDKNRSDNHG